jgi:ABC-2 type transport system permease protein
MMSVLQNAFANSSSSLIQSKITGNLVFLLLTPLSHWAWFLAYVGAAIVRAWWWAWACWSSPSGSRRRAWRSPCGAGLRAAGRGPDGHAGLIAGLWAEKFDQMAAFQNFLIMPMTLLSGVFYSVSTLPPFWQAVSHFNPFFYMIDGFRYGFFGVSDVSPWTSLAVVGGAFLAVSVLTLRLLKSGYKIRN